MLPDERLTLAVFLAGVEGVFFVKRSIASHKFVETGTFASGSLAVCKAACDGKDVCYAVHFDPDVSPVCRTGKLAIHTAGNGTDMVIWLSAGTLK